MKVFFSLLLFLGLTSFGFKAENSNDNIEYSNNNRNQEGVVFINKWKSGEYLGETSGRAMSMKVYKTTDNKKILWVTEDAGGGFVRLKNLGNGKYLHCENGGLQVGDIEEGWQSAMWKISNENGYVSIQNKFTQQFINNQDEKLGLSRPKKKAWNSALWKMRAP